ncbi:MAG TPA: BON domain-containing protein [Terracidiphilus sp.]|nr:BON domain-containing protein [Terracidiphilus sp.]
MFSRFAAVVAFAALLATPSLGLAQAANSAQKNNTNTWGEQDLTRIVGSVRKQLLSLSDYGVFDYLTFAIQGHSVILNGYASRPVLKSEAEKVVKGIKGVESVQNNIKVLPYSQMDDRIRVGELVRIYGQPSLRKYTNAPIGQDLYPTVGRMAGGITQDPPVGWFAIHIIVENGHVILAGVVDNPTDAEIANVQANTVPGVFSVTDNLVVPNAPAKEKVK